MRKLVLPVILMLGVFSGAAQTNPALEFAAGAGNPTGNGPTISNQIITFQNNTNNPTGNTFASYTPTRTATFSLINQQRTMVPAPGVGVMFGGNVSLNSSQLGSGVLYESIFSSPSNANANHFRSFGGSGISGSEGLSGSNFGVRILASARPLYEANASLPAVGNPVRYQMADLVITFNTPVNNPILHFVGLGGNAVSGSDTLIRFSSELELLTPGVTHTRLSGSSEFSVPNTTEILNSAAVIGPITGVGAASGSVQVNGQNITSLVYRVFIKATVGNAPSGTSWHPPAPLDTAFHAVDGFLVGVSLGESDLAITKTINNATALIGSNVVFTVTATNNGPSNDQDVVAQDLLPSGYTYVSHNVSAGGGTYNPVTGIWAIGNLNSSESRTLSITASVNATGNYTSAASISGFNGDAIIVNNKDSISITDNCFSEHIAANNTIEAFWPMDKNTSDVLPLTGSNNAIAVGAGVSLTTDAFAGNYAVSFAGTGGIRYSDGTFMNNAFTNLAWGAWIKPAAVTGGGIQMLFDEGAANGVSVFLSNAGQIIFVAAKVNATPATADLRFNFPTDGAYHHIAFTYTNGLLRVFLDGMIMGALETGYTTIGAHGNEGGIGAIFGNNSAAQVRFSNNVFGSYTGLMDEVFYTRSALTPGNVLQYARCHGRNNFTSAGCVSDAFFVQGPNGDFNSVNLVTGQFSPAQNDGIQTFQNAIGFNDLDGLVYGIEWASGNIFVTEITSTPSGFNFTSRRAAFIPEFLGQSLNTGDIYNGKYYLRTQNTNIYYIIDVDPSSPTYLELLSTNTSSITFNTPDWSFNPIDDQLYAVSTVGDLLRINPITGVVTNLGASVPAGNYGATFFDNQGYFYAYNNATGLIYRIDISDANYTGVIFSSGPTTLNNDGARCAGAPLPIDFGDAPDASTANVGAGTGVNQYQTMLSNNGPRHLVKPHVPLRMGATVTLENDGKPSAQAIADTDDGISSFPNIYGDILRTVPSYELDVSVTNLGDVEASIYGWIDWNSDGVFQTSERAMAAVPAATNNGTVTLSWANARLGGSSGTVGVFARFRISTDTAAASPVGPAFDGEVEDYFILLDNPLPVKLISFDAYKKGTVAELLWSTASEKNNRGFEVERSTDGSNFTKVGFVASRGEGGNSTLKLDYTFTDYAPTNGRNLYRLKQTDFDGKYDYSTIKAVIFDKGAGIIIFPNPTTEMLNITGLLGNEKLTIFNSAGVLVYQQVAAESQMGVSFKHLSEGLYLLKVKSDDGTIATYKIVKTN